MSEFIVIAAIFAITITACVLIIWLDSQQDPWS